MTRSSLEVNPRDQLSEGQTATEVTRSPLKINPQITARDQTLKCIDCIEQRSRDHLSRFIRKCANYNGAPRITSCDHLSRSTGLRSIVDCTLHSSTLTHKTIRLPLPISDHRQLCETYYVDNASQLSSDHWAPLHLLKSMVRCTVGHKNYGAVVRPSERCQTMLSSMISATWMIQGSAHNTVPCAEFNLHRSAACRALDQLKVMRIPCTQTTTGPNRVQSPKNA